MQPYFIMLGIMWFVRRLGRKVITNLDSVLKNRDITLRTQVCIVKAVVFLWTIKKAEC